MKTTLRRGGGMVLIAAHLLAFPVVAQDAPAIPSLYLTARGALDEFDCVLVLPPTQVEEHERFALGDAHGFLHVYEQREQAEAKLEQLRARSKKTYFMQALKEPIRDSDASEEPDKKN